MRGLAVLVAPGETLAAAADTPRPWRWGLTIAILVVGLGGLTLPRQLPALAGALVGPLAPEHGYRMLAGLRRLILVDRLVPPITPILAGALVYLLATAWLPRTAAARRALCTVVLLGLAPLAVLRAGELVTVWLSPGSGLPPGAVLALPRRFAAGPLLLADRAAAAPLLDLIDARANLFTLWMAGLWALGLRRVGGGRWTGWHWGVPVLALMLAGIGTALLTVPVLGLLLGVR